jgi:hypothetical protein
MGRAKEREIKERKKERDIAEGVYQFTEEKIIKKLKEVVKIHFNLSEDLVEQLFLERLITYLQLKAEDIAKNPAELNSTIDNFVDKLNIDDAQKQLLKDFLKDYLKLSEIKIDDSEVYEAIKFLFKERNLDEAFNKIKTNDQAEKFYDAIHSILNSFWDGKPLVKIIDSESFIITLKDLHKEILLSATVFDEISPTEKYIDILHEMVPEAEQVNEKVKLVAKSLSSTFEKISFQEKRIIGTLEGFKELLGKGLKDCKITPEEAKEIMSNWSNQLDEILKEQEPEKKKEKISKFGQSLKDGIVLLSTILGTGFLAWSALFAFYLPLYLIDKMEATISKGLK